MRQGVSGTREASINCMALPGSLVAMAELQRKQDFITTTPIPFQQPILSGH
jgi:hypothetical protein